VRRAGWALAAAALVAGGGPAEIAPARAAGVEPRLLKMAMVAPDGTLWAQEVRAAGGEIEALTNGALRVKWYVGGVSGDEIETGARIVKGQLDGIVSAGILCEQVSATLRAIRIPGMFDSPEEAHHVTDRLRAPEEAEALAAGFVLLGTGSMGEDVIFSNEPVRSLADLRKMRIWKWEGDEVGIAVARAMGVTPVPTALLDGERAYEAGRLDGFFAIPTAALAFQWSAHSRYVTTLPVGHLNGCCLMSSRSFDRLPIDQQQVVRAAIAKLAGRVEQVSQRQDAQLLGGLFGRQGAKVVAPPPSLRGEFRAAAAGARAHLNDALVPRAAIERVLKAVADYRAQSGVAHRK
jgi:TRAP-type C4-dicarboxylate transport system substrate-binding protein